jgi:hypothetical protein
MVRQTLITVDIITRQLAAFNKCANSIQRMVEPNTLFSETVAFSRKWTFVLWARSNFKKIEKARNFWKHSLGDYSFIFPDVLRHYFVHYIVTFKERFFKLTPICWIGLEPDEALSGFIRSLPLEDGIPVSNIKTLRQQKLEIFAPWKRTRKWLLRLRCDGYMVFNYVILDKFYIKLVVMVGSIKLFAGWSPIPFFGLKPKPNPFQVKPEDSLLLEYEKRYGFHPSLGVRRHSNFFAMIYRKDALSKMFSMKKKTD